MEKNEGILKMKIQLIAVPYDTGHFNKRMGMGPTHLVNNGVPEEFEASGHDVDVETVELDNRFLSEIGSAFELKRKIALAVSRAASNHRFPIVLAGNCNASVGVMAGIEKQRTGIVWFDGHGDYNTPETTTTGYLDGMGLAVITGLCWQSLAARIPGYTPLPPENAMLIGARDLDPPEEDLLKRTGVAMAGISDIRQKDSSGSFGSKLDILSGRVDGLHVHIDLDILDPSVAHASHLAPPGGLMLDEFEAALEQISSRFTILAGSLTAYDPGFDQDGRALEACKRILVKLVNLAAKPR